MTRCVLLNLCALLVGRMLLLRQVQCMLLSKEDLWSCMNEKKFQEVLEEVVYQRAAYREQREMRMEQKVHTTLIPFLRFFFPDNVPHIQRCSSHVYFF